MSEPRTKEHIEQLAKRIRPIVEREGKLYFIEDIDLDDFFTWVDDVKEPATDLIVIGSAETRHRCYAPAFFKPTVSQVLEQMPAEYEEECCAFSVHGPQTADDLNREIEALNEGFHVATTLFYARV